MISSSAQEGSVGSVRKMLTSPTMHWSSATLPSAHRFLSRMMKVHSGTMQSGFKDNDLNIWTILCALNR